jgi:hypothetical protein
MSTERSRKDPDEEKRIEELSAKIAEVDADATVIMEEVAPRPEPGAMPEPK